MLDVYFESDKEVIHFCERLFFYTKEIELNWKTHEEWGNQLHFQNELVNDDGFQIISLSMVDVFKKYRLPNLLRKIIKNDFYYTNHDEIERILDVSLWFLHDNDLDFFLPHQNPLEELPNIFLKHLKMTNKFHFDSIIKFRLREFIESLKDYVGLSIDEFKQEEDHQAFIETLRKYIRKQKPVYDELHILQGENFTFFNKHGRKFSPLELRTIIYDKPLYIVGLDVDELNLAPLVAIAPQKIYIYGEDPADPKTSTVINVFHERVIFKPIEQLPFSLTSKT